MSQKIQWKQSTLYFFLRRLEQTFQIWKVIFYFLLVSFLFPFPNFSHSTPNNLYKQSRIYSFIFFCKFTNDTHICLCLGICKFHIHLYIPIFIHFHVYTYKIGFVIYLQNGMFYIFLHFAFFMQKKNSLQSLQVNCFALIPYTGCLVFYVVTIPWFIQSCTYWCAFTLFLGKGWSATYPYNVVCFYGIKYPWMEFMAHSVYVFFKCIRCCLRNGCFLLLSMV